MNGWGKVKPSAKHAGVSERTFRPWLKNGLPHSRLPSGTILVKFSDIDEYLKSFEVIKESNGNDINKTVDEIFREFA